MRETRETMDAWLEALERRHLADLRFAEVTRALRALSVGYVQRRGRVRHAALDGRGKRAAFALFYGPLHFMVVDRVARALEVAVPQGAHVIDLGCGSGAAGAALALAGAAGSITGIDRHPWAVEEAAWTYAHFGLRHRTVHGDAVRALRADPPGAAADRARRAVLLAAYTANELTDEERAALLPLVLERAAKGAAVLIVEPIARAVAPWWAEWAAAFARAGGRSDEWRFADPLPARVREFDRAAGLDHREQTARSLWITPPRA